MPLCTYQWLQALIRPKLAAMTQAVTEQVESQQSKQNIVLARLGMIISSHLVIDLFSAIVGPMIGVLQVRCDLTPGQTAGLLGIGSLSSGITQPFSAWLSDRLDTRLFGAIGLAVAAICLTSIGLADDFTSLVVIFVIGMVGVGIFHPIAASTTGQLSEQLNKRKRSLGISIFFVAGMVGGALGSLVAGLVAVKGDVGFENLRLTVVPGLIFAVALHLMIRKVPHRHHEHHLIRFEDGEVAKRWFAIAVLYVASSIRFTVNMAVVYLIVRWAEAHAAILYPTYQAEQIAEQGAKLAATALALLVVGMAVGGLVGGTIIRNGKEKWPQIILPIIFAPVIAFYGNASLGMGYALSVFAGISFASMIPVTLSMAQRLLPHRTSLASGIMLGGAWMVAATGPSLAEYCLGSLGMSISKTFVYTALLLVVSGLVCLLLDGRFLHKTAESVHD